MARLQRQLRSRGLELQLRAGPSASTLLDVASSCGAQLVIAEREVESDWATAIASVADGLKARGGRLACWQATVWPAVAFAPNYRSWANTRGLSQAPLPAPAPGALAPASGPLAAPAAPLDAAAVAKQLREWAEASQSSGDLAVVAAKVEDAAGASPAAAAVARVLNPPASPNPGSNPTPDLLETLRAYLRLAVMPPPPELEWIRNDAPQFESPAAEGASFTALFGAAMRLGAISRRQVYHEALQVSNYSAFVLALRVLCTEAERWHERRWQPCDV